MLGWKFFCWYIFGNVTCTIRGDAGKSAIIVCILGGGTGRGNGSGTKIGFTLVSDGGLNNCVGCTFGGRNDGRGRMRKQGCFTLRFNICKIWQTDFFVASPYDRKGRALGVSLIISRMFLTASLR